VAKKRNKHPTPQAFLDLETQFDQLCGKSDFDEEAAAEIASQISEICSRLPLTPMFQFGESLTYSDWFIKKLYRRYRSSGDWLDSRPNGVASWRTWPKPTQRITDRI
jgi:hypothetical protein